MKANRTIAILEAILLVVALLTAIIVGAQGTAPLYKFKNPVLVSGTDGQVNAVYKFPGVKTTGGNIDALVKIQNKVGNITLESIDRTADGYSEAFQPQYSIGANSTGYFEFLITFVNSNNNNNAINQPAVDLSGLDIDGLDTLGYMLKEFNRIDMGGGICSFNLMGSQLVLSHPGTAYDGNNFTGILFGALVDTLAKEVMFTVSNVNVTSFTYRVGATNGFPVAMSRYASLYPKKFNYPQNVILAVNNLASFSGAFANNKRNLKWTLNGGNDVAGIMLEKSNTGSSFFSLADFNSNDKNIQNEFSYADGKDYEEAAYYRLKLISKTGKVEYSNILRFGSEKNNTNQLAVYPSLVQSATTISYISNEKQAAVIMVSDMSGRTVKQQNVLLEKGTNSIQVSGFEQYRKGNYIVTVAAAGQKSAKQIVVQ